MSILETKDVEGSPGTDAERGMELFSGACGDALRETCAPNSSFWNHSGLDPTTRDVIGCVYVDPDETADARCRL